MTVNKIESREAVLQLLKAIFQGYLSRNFVNLKKRTKELSIRWEEMERFQKKGYLKLLDFGEADANKHYERIIF